MRVRDEGVIGVMASAMLGSVLCAKELEEVLMPRSFALMFVVTPISIYGAISASKGSTLLQLLAISAKLP